MKRKIYTQEQVENIVNNALAEQQEEFEKIQEREEMWNAINDLKEKVDKLIKEGNKAGF